MSLKISLKPYLPEKKDINELLPVAQEDYECLKEISARQGFNFCLSLLAEKEIEVVVDEEKVKNIVKEFVNEFYSVPDPVRQNTNVIVYYPDKLAHALASADILRVK